MVGALAANFHEGSRSEYLAQFAFASFGTAVAVPHHEDFGLDLYCTLAERRGKRLLPTAHYTVQVKSSRDPWIFSGEDEVAWFVRHPFPLFLCIVDKPSLTLSIYHTSPRFYAWASPPLPSRLEVVPGIGVEGKRPEWSRDNVYSLSAPIVQATLVDLQSEEFRSNIASTLKFWIDCEQENLERIRMGIHAFVLPDRYTTNSSTGHHAWIGEGFGSTYPIDLSPALKRLGLVVAWVGRQLHVQKDLPGAARCALLLRHLFPQEDYDDLHWALRHLPFVHDTLNHILNKHQYVFAGIDHLASTFDDQIGQRNSKS